MNADPIKVTFMELSEIWASAQALSNAMLNNSIHLAVFKGNEEKQRVKIENMFVHLFEHNPAITYIAKEESRIVGVMRMKSCCGAPVKKRVGDNKNESDIDRRIKMWHRQWAAHDPREQHWHLGPIGVIPSHQGYGVGSRLMEIFCREVDKCSAKAFLETDLDQNVSFYKKFGFKVVSTSTIFGIESRYMAREIAGRTYP